MRILLTGAIGFIGHHLANRLLNDGHYVVGVDHNKPAYGGKLPDMRLETIRNNPNIKNFEFHNLDLTDLNTLDILKPLGPFESIIHLAAYPGVRGGELEPTKYYMNNITSHSAVFEIAKNSPESIILYASSSSVYGDLGAQGSVSEDSAAFREIKSVYGTTKWINELQSEQFFKNFGIQSIGLRFFTVFGSLGRPDMAYAIFAKNMQMEREIPILADLDSLRDYTYIEDLLTQIVLLIEGLQKREHPVRNELNKIGAMKINLGLGSPKKLSEIISCIEFVLEKKAKFKFLPQLEVDSLGTYADNSKMRSYFPEIQVTNFRDAISRTLNLDQGEWFMD